MGYKLIFNPFSCEFEFINTNRISGIFPVNYVSVTELTLPSLGSAYAPDSYNVVNGELVLFTALTNTANRGVYKASVSAGKVIAWTRIAYGQSPTGESTDGDMIVCTEGATYQDHTFQCTDTATATWLDLGVIRNYWVRIGSTLYPDFGNDHVSGMSFIPMSDGAITRVGDYISSVELTGRTLTITRNTNNYITSITDGTRTWTYTRDANNYIASWSVV